MTRRSRNWLVQQRQRRFEQNVAAFDQDKPRDTSISDEFKDFPWDEVAAQQGKPAIKRSRRLHPEDSTSP